MSGTGSSERVAAEVASWPGVTSRPHRFGTPEDADEVIRLFRLAYERAAAALERRSASRTP